MIHLRRFGAHHFALSSSHYSKVLYQIAKSTPGMRWDSGERAWVGYADACEVVINRCKAHGETVKGELPDAEIKPDAIFLRQPAFRDLYDYQKDALRFLLANAGAGAILGLQVGLGKTPVSLRLARAFKEPTVVVAPAFASGVWESHVKRWWPEAAPALVLKGTKASPLEAPAPKVVIANYSIIHAWVETLIAARYRVLILDEGHMVQGAAARRTAALYQLRASCVAALALTGTPIPNYVKNLWLLCDILSPGRFGQKFFGFGLRYCGGKQVQVSPEKLPDKVVWDFKGSSNEQELHNRLRWFMFRRTKAEVAQQLPALTRQIVEFDVTPTAKKSKKPVPNAYRSIIKPGGGLDVGMLHGLMAAAADRKIPQAVDLIASHLDAGHRVVVASRRRIVAERVADLLQARGFDHVDYMHGEMPPAKRQEKLKAIRSEVRCLAVTYDSMGVAVDLTFASIGVAVELTYEPHVFEQIEGRLHRLTQEDPVLWQYCIARGSIDEMIRDAVVKKLITQEKTVGDSHTGLRKDFKPRTAEQVLDELARRILES